MKLISIDIETTGLTPGQCSVLEVGAVIFDPQPIDEGWSERLDEARESDTVKDVTFRPVTFERIIKHSTIQGDPYALQMNQEIIQELAGVKKTHIPIVSAAQCVLDLRDFIKANTGEGEKLTPCGKNYGSFDQQFLERLPGWRQNVKPLLDFRSLDVGSLYFNPSDGKILGLPKCLDKIGCSGLVTHRALDDALAVMTAITRFFA